MDNGIWTHPQFLVSDVCKITGITPKALENFVSPKRDLVRLIGPHVNPGTGRRRIFSGGQVLMIAAAYAMTSIGFPQRKVRVITDIVLDRAMLREKNISNDQSNFMIGTFPMGDDWRVVLLHDKTVDRSALPISIQRLDVDRHIDQIKAQLFPF